MPVFKAEVWVYRDVLIRPGEPFSAPAKLSEAWTRIDHEPEIHAVEQVIQIQDISDRPRRGRPPKDK